MKKVIYYPTFESYNSEWLKFALLYISELKPIVPESGDRYLSDLYNKIIDETDLLNFHRPESHDGEFATLRVIDTVENVLRNPDRYSSIFQMSNIRYNWENRRYHKFTIFEEKYSHQWLSFCESNRFCTPTRDGIKVSKSLANLYMTVLAHSIGQRTGISPITDRVNLNKFSLMLGTAPVQEEAYNIAKSIIKLKLPKDLKEISFDDVIKLRNKKGYKDNLNAFNGRLDQIMSLEENVDLENILTSLNSRNNELNEDLLSLGINLGAMALGIWLVIGANGAGVLEAIKELLGVGSFFVGGHRTVTNYFGESNQERLCKRYLANLKTL